MDAGVIAQCEVSTGSRHDVQRTARPVLLVSVRSVLQETFALYGATRVPNLRDE